MDITLDTRAFEDDLKDYFGEWLDWQPLKPDIAEIVRTSIDINFEVGGRYGTLVDGEWTGGENRWVESKRAKREGGITLTDEGLLALSVDVYWEGDELVMTSNLPYAPALHYGTEFEHPGGTPYISTDQPLDNAPNAFRDKNGKVNRVIFLKKDGVYPVGVKFTKAHVIVIPPRPFLVIQKEDNLEILQLFIDRGKKLRPK